MAIATNCPNCNAKFNLSDDLEGKTVKCKRCQTSFVVSAADAIASKPPRSSARDDDDIDDEDRREPPSRKSRRRDDDDDDDDDREDDDEPRRRPRRRSDSSEKRGRKKGKSSSMLTIVLILVGVGALFLVCCGIGGVVAVVKLRDPGGLGAGANTRIVLGPDNTFRHENRLTSFDKIKDGKRFRTYTMTMEAGKTYQFDMISDQLDSFLFILDNTNNIVALDDDGGGFPNARIVFRPQRTGEFQIQTTSFMDRETGTFFLTVRRF